MFQTHKLYTKFKAIGNELMKMCTFLSIDNKRLNFPIEFAQSESLLKAWATAATTLSVAS